MKAIEKIANFVEGALAFFGESLMQSASDYVDISGVEDHTTFVLKDGSRMSLVRINGSRRMIGVDEFQDIDHRLTTSLQAFMRGGGHAISCIFESDYDDVEREIREAQVPMRQTAEKLNLALDDLFEEDVRVLKQFCASERAWIALYTRPSAFTSAELKRDNAARMELLKDNPLPTMEDAPNLFRVIAGLKSRHDSFVSSLVQELGAAEIALTLLDVHEAARDMRMTLDREFTSEDWKPCLPGDRIPVREHRRNPEDVSGALWPRLERQLTPRDLVEISPTVCRAGDRIYKPMYINQHQIGSAVYPFQDLFKRVRGTGVPWRIKFQIEGAGLQALSYKRMVTAIIGFTNRENGMFRDAVSNIEYAVEHNNDLDMKLRVDLTSWAMADQMSVLENRTSRLARAVQSWGGVDVRELSGDPVQAMMATTAGLSLKSPATVSCALLSDATQMLPLYRPASPWTFGALMFRSPDGKLFPFQPSSSVQSNWINIVIAEPRAGKSVLVNAINLALNLSPGLEDLPYIAIIDIGRASSGFTSLLAQALPEGQRHKVAQFRMRMRREDAVNPFDTQLGCRRPLPHEEAFVTNFLTLLMTPAGEDCAPDGMPGLCSGVIEAAYRKYADDGEQPKRYSPNTEGAELVDEAINRYRVHLDPRTTWWEVVDQLFAAGDVHAAGIAQRFAVPTLMDLSAISGERQFHDLYGQKSTPSGEPILSAFIRMLSEAVRRYPILTRPTQFDISDARVVSIDLDEVAKQGSAVADHQTNVCYMLARHVAARNFYLREEHIDAFPEAYRRHHDKRIREIRQSRKHLCFDEVHRTKNAASTRAQLELDAREGGKWGVMLTLISHRPDDFPPAVLAFATSCFVISPADDESAALMAEKWLAKPTVQYAAKHHIKPPSKKGSTMVTMFKTRDGDVTQLLNLTMGGIRLWAFSTSNEDSYVRDVLYAKIGGPETRWLLSRLYPSGTMLPEIERRKIALANAGSIIDAEKEEGVINEMIREILAKYDAHRLREGGLPELSAA